MSGHPSELLVRPTCACHGQPMWGNGRARWRCSVKERARNKTRIRLGTTLVGREHQFPAPREAMVAFVQNLKEATLGTHE